MAKNTTIHVIIPPQLKREFKSTCVLEGVNMSEVVCDLIQKWLDDRNAKPDRDR